MLLSRKVIFSNKAESRAEAMVLFSVESDTLPTGRVSAFAASLMICQRAQKISEPIGPRAMRLTQIA
jgi:hypothetical protein